MIRYEDINDISDGKLYSESDVVPIGTNGCAGCSHRCRSDMGHSIVLNPYDIYELTKATGKSFDELLVAFIIEISIIDTVALPHLKMDEGCKFLKNDRCSIHTNRPGICRLFPLGRIYDKDDFSYFIQTTECPCENKTPVKISDWLGIAELDKNTEFIKKWHRFLRFEQKKVSTIREMSGYEVNRIQGMDEEELEIYAGIIGEEDDYKNAKENYRVSKVQELQDECDEAVKEVMKSCISILFMNPYDTETDFYEQFDIRLKRCISVMRQIN